MYLPVLLSRTRTITRTRTKNHKRELDRNKNDSEQNKNKQHFFFIYENKTVLKRLCELKQHWYPLVSSTWKTAVRWFVACMYGRRVHVSRVNAAAAANEASRRALR